MSILRRLILALALSAGLAPAFAQAPAPVPALPDTERRTTYSISASTCACAVGFQLYGDSTDVANWMEVFVNGVLITQSGNWAITSPSGVIANLPRPITDAVLTFTTAQTGTVQIVGARRPRRTTQFQESQPVPTRNFNQTFSDIIATQRELWDKTNDITGRAVLGRPGETLALLPVLASRANMGACFDSGGNLTSCVSVSGSTFIAGNGITFTGTNPTTIANNIQAGPGVVVSGTNPLTITAVQPPGGRLSLVTLQSRPMADVSAATTIYYVPDVNPTVPVPNGSAFQSYNIGFGSQLSASLSAANILAASVYDEFVTISGGVPVLCVYSVGWTTGSRTASVATHGAFSVHNTLGFWSNTASLTHCYGGVAGTTDYGPIAADNALYVGSEYASANGQFSHVMRPVGVAGGNNTMCTLFNAYNNVDGTCKSQDSTAQYVSQATAIQIAIPCNSGLWGASFTASIATTNGGTMTVSAISAGAIVPGMHIFNVGATQVAGYTIVLAYGTNGTTGVGGTGTYRVQTSQTVGSEAMVGSNLNMRINFVDGLANNQWLAKYGASIGASTNGVVAASTVEIGLDQTVASGGAGAGAFLQQSGIGAATTNNWGDTIYTEYDPYPTVGFHYLQCIESGANISYFALDFAGMRLVSRGLW